MFNACYNGNLKRVKYLINKYGNSIVNKKDEYGNTALHSCSNGRYPEIAKFLVDNGANINEKNNNGYTPLHSCCFKGESIEILQFLISCGASIDEVCNIDENTPLMEAISNDLPIEIIKALIDGGAHINHKNKYGNTPLHNISIGNGYYYTPSKLLAEYLVSKGARIDIKNNCGSTPLHTACYYGRVKIVKFFLSLKETIEILNEKDFDGLTPLHECCRPNAPIKMVKCLIEHGAKYNIKCNKDGSLLDYSKKYNPEIMKFIEEYEDEELKIKEPSEG